MPRNIQHNINQLYGVLTLELNRFSEGQQFFSVRELIQKHRMSRRVVEKTLERLKDENQIEIEPTRGVYVGQRQKTSYTITSVHCDWAAEYWVALDGKVEQEVKKHENWHFSRSFFEPNSQNGYLKCLKEIHGDAILFTFPIHQFSSSEIADILQLDTPVIFMEDNLFCDGINIVDSQPEFSGMQAAECLIRNGHRKVAMILSEPWSAGEARRNAGFLNYVKLHGLKPIIIDCEVQGGEASCAKAHEKMLEYLQKNGPVFTGCYTMSDYSALGIISAIREFGLRVPDDISVIGNGGIPSSAHYDPPLTTIYKNPDVIASAVVDGLQDLFSGGSFGIRSVSTTLLERKSVKNIKNKE